MIPIHFLKQRNGIICFSTFGYDGYIQPSIKNVDDCWKLILNADINYESGELKSFLEWIKPYIICVPEYKHNIGKYATESCIYTLIYLHNNELLYENEYDIDVYSYGRGIY